MIRFVVECPPVAQPRQKHRALKGGGVMNYVERSHPVQAFKAAVHLASIPSVLWLMAHGGMMLGPLRLVLDFSMIRPKRLGRGGRVPHAGKPDADNLAKAVMDALKERVWKDDCQVVSLTVTKWYAATGEKPGVDVCVTAFVPDGGEEAKQCA